MTELQAVILIVDDEITVRKRLEALLLPRGYKVLTASNGLEALRQVQQERPDLIVLDVLMPELDGFEVCRRLKENAETSLIPVVLVTVLGDVEDRVKGLEAGADDFLTKPVHREEFLARIRTSLRLKQTIDRKVGALQQQIQETTARRLQLFAMLSHELRTQLDTIIGFAEVLQEQTYGALNAQQEEYVQYILTSGPRVLDVLHGLLALGKLEAGETAQHYEVLALRPLLEESLVLIRGRALAHDITLSLEVAHDVETVVSDGRQVQQVVFNLLSRALEETPDHGQVGIKASKFPDRVEVAVWDTGEGLSSAELQRLFEEWLRLVERRTGPSARISLELALTKRFVELLGGTMRIESQPRQGNTFTFSLPIPGTQRHTSLLVG